MKNILKRIFVGVSIALIIMLIKGNLVGNVYAETNSNQIIYQVPNEDNLHNYNNVIVSNFATNTTDPLTPFGMSVNYYYGYPYKNSPTELRYWAITDGHSIDSTYEFRSGYDGMSDTTYTALNQISISTEWWGDPQQGTYWNSLRLYKNVPYEVLIEIEKTNNMNFYANPDNIFQDSSTYGINIVDNYSRILPQSTIDYKNIQWIPPSKVGGGGGNNNLAYIKVRFEINDIAPNNTEYYLSNMQFISGTPRYASVSTSYGSPVTDIPFVFNSSGSVGMLKIKSISLIETGFIEVISNGSDIPGATPGLDSVSYEDLTSFHNNFNTCSLPNSALDLQGLGEYLACNFDNFLNGIKILITRIGNFFTNLISNIKSIFVPEEGELHNKLEALFLHWNAVLSERLGFLYYPFELLNNIVQRFNNMNTNQHSITLPELREPFSNTTIYNGGSLDLYSIFHEEKIEPLYNIYYSFVTVYVILLFVNLCIDSFTSFIEGSPLKNSNLSNKSLNNID